MNARSEQTRPGRDSSTPYIPRRHIHLDFHTGPAIPGVGSEFDPRKFAETYQAVDADSVTVFAKCHHGLLYTDTDHPARHPGLASGLDLVAQQVEALHEVGIKAPVYISVQVDEYAADHHPEWLAVQPDLRQAKRAPSTLEAGWQVLDMSSPYQDYFADQLDMVLRRFAPMDGLFLDMCWDQPSVSRWALDGMRKQGLDPRADTDRRRYARGVAHAYMARFRDMVQQAHHAHPDSRPASIFFNSRPRILGGDEHGLSTHQEIESLPTGGWGYAYTPFIGRFVRGFGIPGFGMTGRFHASWGDNAGLKPSAALLYECTQLLGLGFGISVGDVLHPRGTVHEPAYRVIGDVFGHLAACDPYVTDATVRSEVAMLVAPDRGSGVDLDGRSGPDRAQSGAVRLLQQTRQQFDVVTPEADLSAYRLLVVPESTPAEDVRETVDAYVRAGGSVLLTGQAAVDTQGRPLLSELGVDIEGDSPYTHTFLRAGPELASALAERQGPDSAPDADIVLYERGLRIRPGSDSTVLARVVEPYFERSYDRFCGHAYTPPDRETEYAAVVETTLGTGRVITVAEPLFETFARFGNVAYRELFASLLDRLLPDPLLRAGGPAHLETAVHTQGQRTVVHLVSFLPTRQGDNDLVTDPFPLVDVPVSVRATAAPQRVSSEPGGVELPFEHRDGYLHTKVSSTAGHVLIVLE